MRHVSRTHSVALDWLFDRINLDSKIQIRHIDTKHQLADILTKERDEWNNLLHLFNISHFSCTCCAKISSLISCAKTMAEKVQEQKGDNRIVAKSKPTTMNLASSVSTSSSSVNSPIASKSPGILKASSRLVGCSGKLDAKRNSKPDAASSSQGWQREIKVRSRGSFLNLIHGATARKKWQGNLLHPEIQKVQEFWSWKQKMAT